MTAPVSAPTSDAPRSSPVASEGGGSVVVSLAVDPEAYGQPLLEVAVVVDHVYPLGQVRWHYADDADAEWWMARVIQAQLEDLAHAGELGQRVAA